MEHSPEPRKRRPKGNGSLFQRKSDGLWYYAVVYKGHALKRCLGDFPSESEAWTEAEIVKADFLTRIANGELEPSTPATVTVSEVLDRYVRHLNLHAPKSAYVITCCVNATLRPHFGKRLVASLTTGDLQRFREERERQGRSAATINRDLSYLRTAFILESKSSHARIVPGSIPHFPIEKETQADSIFIGHQEYRTILEKLPTSLKCLFVIAYHLGISRSELLNLTFDAVDLRNRILWLIDDDGNTRRAPIYGDMEPWLSRQKRLRDSKFPDATSIFFWVAEDVAMSHGGYRLPPGSPVRRFEGTWDKAVSAAGHTGLRFQDIRASAVRNMIEGVGISEAQALDISGYKTRSVVVRHNINPPVMDVQKTGRLMSRWAKALKAT